MKDMSTALILLASVIGSCLCDVSSWNLTSSPACPPPLPAGGLGWRANRTVEILFPNNIGPSCDNCSTVTTVNANVTLQSGDSIVILLPNSGQETTTTVEPTTLSDDYNSTSETAVNESSSSNVGVHLFEVNRADFERCSTEEGLDVKYNFGDDRIEVHASELEMGVTYFVGKTEHEDSQCLKLEVTVKETECGDGDVKCYGKGLCFTNSTMSVYSCKCCEGHIGAICQEKDACSSSPCQNSGICMDQAAGIEDDSFRCLCPYGYTGSTCEKSMAPCDTSPCRNGGSCIGNQTHFHCSCQSGFSGSLCEQNIDECGSSPCVHGICVDQVDGYRCFCQPGFGGEHCEYEYNECESSPCINGGTCMDHIGKYQCLCGRGYTGTRCHVKVDLCDPNPCEAKKECVDRGNNYTCECPSGFSGPSCDRPSQVCDPNPCHHGGTCWTSIDSFFCACAPGYTGTTCEDKFVLEAIPTVPENREALDLQMPISIHLDHLHNVYIAAGTLVSALLIVVLVVAVCHCRVNETYKRCSFRIPTVCGHLTRLAPCRTHDKTLNLLPVDNSSNANKHVSFRLDQNPAPTSDMYYTLDFSETQQDSPLIK